MKNYISILAFAFVTIACSSPPEHRGINLGKQNAAITLAAGNNNDLAIASARGNTTTMLRLTADAAGSTLTGMDASTVADGDLFLLRNEAAAGILTITNADALSLLANRFVLANASSYILPPKSGALVEYDSALGWTMPLAVSGQPTFTGKIKSNGTGIPVLSGCGTTPTIVAGSTDFAGKLTTGSAATTCTITFSSTWGTAPSCILTPEGGATHPTYTTSATAITVTVDIASTVYNYVCVGR